MNYTLCESTESNLEAMKSWGFKFDSDFKIITAPLGWTPCEYLEDCMRASNQGESKKVWRSEQYCTGSAPYHGATSDDGRIDEFKVLWCGTLPVFHYGNPTHAAFCLYMSKTGLVSVRWEVCDQ